MILRFPNVTEPVSRESYDALLCAAGFESRAIKVATTLASKARKRLAYGFSTPPVLAFEKNMEFFRASGFQFSDVSDEDFRSDITEQLIRPLNVGRDVVHVAIDVSCFNRVRLATIVDILRTLQDDFPVVHVDFFYTLAEYSPPDALDCANTHVGPVCKQFAGWTSNPSLPPAAVVGLGYERDKALGALDHLQVAHALLLLPNSEIPEYLDAVRSSNESLIRNTKSEYLLNYRVEDPSTLYVMLDSILGGLQSHFNTILLPFGPKIFFVVNTLVACHYPSAAVWRVSGNAVDRPVDRLPSAHEIVLSTTFASDRNDRIDSDE